MVLMITRVYLEWNAKYTHAADGKEQAMQCVVLGGGNFV